MRMKRPRPAARAPAKTVASMIREAVDKNGYKDIKECARGIKVPYDLFNKVVGGHIPKDAQLIEYAGKLKLDSRELILAAYREKAPEEMKQYFNSVALLENHNEKVKEMLEILDSSNSDQMEQLLEVGRLVRDAPREFSRKAAALMRMYQHLEREMMDHMDSLILLALRVAAFLTRRGLLRRGTDNPPAAGRHTVISVKDAEHGGEPPTVSAPTPPRGRPKTGSAVRAERPAAPAAAAETEATAATAGPPVDFVAEDDVRAAVERGEKIRIGPDTIITPLAREQGEEHEVFRRN